MLDASQPRVRVPCRLPEGSVSQPGPESDDRPGVQAEVFAGGKVRIQGARSEEELRECTRWLLPVLEAARCSTLVAGGRMQDGEEDEEI
ncbi:unnamed protein product [Polarella glacialis]|uniref:Uncharacterized protein n=2 Tax=Polarella glacialis TaxID=89957 RepID=A0A813JTN3_POLGL|nr:unnamed protein product [Polarella glacialis]